MGPPNLLPTDSGEDGRLAKPGLESIYPPNKPGGSECKKECLQSPTESKSLASLQERLSGQQSDQMPVRPG